MNPCNSGNQFTTYTLIVLDSLYFDLSTVVLRYLVKDGHVVTMIHDTGEHQDVGSAVGRSDVLIVFTDPSNEYAKNLARDFSGIEGTFSVAVHDGAQHEFNGFNLNLDPKELADPDQCVLRLSIHSLRGVAMYHPYLPHIYPEI